MIVFEKIKNIMCCRILIAADILVSEILFNSQLISLFFIRLFGPGLLVSEAVVLLTFCEACTHRWKTCFYGKSEDLFCEFRLVCFEFILYRDSVSLQFCELGFLRLEAAEFHDQLCL